MRCLRHRVLPCHPLSMESLLGRAFLLLAASISLFAANAHAETVTYLARSLNLVNAQGEGRVAPEDVARLPSADS